MQSKWISVKDREPPKQGKFLAGYTKQNWIGVAWMIEPGVFAYTGGGRLWFFDYWQYIEALPRGSDAK